MEPNDIKCCCVMEKKDKKCACLDIILCILLTLFVGTIGLILGAAFATTLLANIAVLILGTVLLGLLLILTLIYKICACKKNKCCR